MPLERGGDAAVDVQNMAVDERRRMGGEEDAGAGQFFDFAPAAGGGAFFEPGGKILVGDERGVQRRGEVAGGDGVALQAVFAQSAAMPLVRLPTAPLVAV